MKIKKNFDYQNVIKYLSLFFITCVFSSIKTPSSIYGVAVLSVSIALGFNFVLSPLILLLSIVVIGKTGLILSVGIPAVFFIVIGLIYHLKRKDIRFEIVLYTLISLTGFLFFGDVYQPLSFLSKVTDVVITTLLSLILYVSGNVVTKKGLNLKLGFEELFTIALSISLFGLGTCNLISPLVWKSVAVLTLLLVAYLYKPGICVLVSGILGLSLSVYYGNVNYVSLFLLLSVSANAFMPLSRYVSAIALLILDFGSHVLFGVYADYGVYDFISVLLGCLIFTFIPNHFISSLKDKLSLYKEKQLIKQTINRNRVMTSNRLYDLSGVFLDISNSFTTFKNNTPSDVTCKTLAQKEILENVCKNCSAYQRCMENKTLKNSDVKKLVEIGFAKGKLSFIDLPSSLASSCVHPSDIIFSLNRSLADYRNKIIEESNVSSGREILAQGSLGVSEVLKGLAFDCGSLLKFQSDVEKKLSKNLWKEGFLVSEILVYGEANDLSVGLIVSMRTFSIPAVCRIVDNTLGFKTFLAEKNYVTDTKCYLCFKKSCDFDAVFGISMLKKDGSIISGDTHAVTRLRDDKFLVAISDGMGSGKTAESISDASLSLIESFYKAGLNTPLIFNTVNKLLSINTDEIFTALDVAVIDLKTCHADFIKYGSPYGFIIGNDKIRIVEGSSLPLGILEQLKPAVCTAPLEDGDIILMCSDGISDSFNSSSDMIEFLRSKPAKNPQTLSDDVIGKAIELSNGKRNDDMTVLAVRIFKKSG